jgi:2,3-bisphosphoglycerate-dependent phosphoglycerate mutase
LTDQRHARFDPRYRNLRPDEIPATESLKDTLERVLPYWATRIAPELKANRNVLVVAHGNSLRALVKMLDGMSDRDIVEFNIPTGVPLLYELDDRLQKRSSRFLGDPAAIKAAAEAVRRQTEGKR